MKNIQTLVINNTHTLYNENNKYRYIFPQPVEFKNGDSIALNSLMIPYSWFNITSTYNNNTFSLLIPISNSIYNLNIIIPDGSYNINQLNFFLQQKLIENGFYLKDKINNKNIYYIEFIENTNAYKIQINLYTIPSILPTGYEYPSLILGFGKNGLPTTSNTIIRIQFEKLSLGSIIGFENGIYPLTNLNNTNMSILSNKLVNLSPVNSILLNTNLVDNKYNGNSKVFSSFSPFNVEFGSNIVVNNNNLSFISIKSGVYQYIDIEFKDQNNIDLKMNDNNICLILLLSTDL